MRAYSCWSIAMLLTIPAAAETLYNEDGVRLSATVELIDRGAAVCRIREERHSAEDYATLKPNDGQPLHVWRVGLEVANYSGRLLEHLVVHLNVESEWPPCDHWDGPETHYGKVVVWTGPLMLLQRTGELTGLPPGGVARETEFVLVWHHEQPTLGRWDIDYDFAPGEPVAKRQVSEPESRDLPAAVPPLATCTGKGRGARCWMEVEGRPECYLWNPNLQREEIVTWNGGCVDGLASGFGSREWRYSDDEGEETVSQGAGELVGGREHGQWTHRSATGGLEEGPYVDGKRHGRWSLHGVASDDETNRYVFEGEYVEGHRQGPWAMTFENGTVRHRHYENGLVRRERIHWNSGDVDEGPYEDGKKHGRWTERDAGGDVEEGSYMAGRREGRWTRRLAAGTWEEATYADGERSGPWTDRSVASTRTDRSVANTQTDRSAGSTPMVADTTGDNCSRQRLIDLGPVHTNR